MNYQNDAGYYLKNGHAIGSFADYVNARLEALRRPLSAPCYAGPDEQKRLDRLAETVTANPYQWYETISSSAAQLIASLNTQSVTRLSDPLLYDCVWDGCAALRINKPTILTYTHSTSYRYNVMVLGHMNMTWILISQLLREDNLMNDLEITFVVGQALGHYAAHHTDVVQTQKDLSASEQRAHDLTADRAALLSVLWRVHRLYPSLNAEQTVEKALLHALSALHKLDILQQAGKKQTYSEQTLQLAMAKHPLQPTRAEKKDRHPTTWERSEALREFVIAIPFLQCVKTLWGEKHFIAQNYGGVSLFQKNLGSTYA